MKVIMIAAMTLCGRINPVPMGSVIDRKFLEKMRDQTEASLMGAQTLRQDNPVMRGSGGQTPNNRIRAIITRSGEIPVQGKKLFDAGPKPVVFAPNSKVKELEKKLAGRAEVKGLPGNSDLSIKAALDELNAMGAETVLVEGGGMLNYAALHEGVVDELFVTVTPKIIGDTHNTCLVEGPEPLGKPFLKLELISAETAESGEVFLRYIIKKGVMDGR